MFPRSSSPETDIDAYPLGDAEEIVSISRRELESLRDLAAREQAASAERSEQDRRTADLEKNYRSAVRDRELATALAGRPLVSGAASQLIRLLRDEFDVIDAEGSLQVTARDGRPLALAVAERLSEPEFAHFCLPSSRGGSAHHAPNRPAGPSAAPSPKTLGDAALQRWREIASTRSDPASAPIGLRRR